LDAGVFSCTLPTIDSTLAHIHKTWLPASGYQQADGPALELYDGAFDPENRDSLMYVYIPVE
jgi:predicted transcriptional regulator YdeE